MGNRVMTYDDWYYRTVNPITVVNFLRQGPGYSALAAAPFRALNFL